MFTIQMKTTSWSLLLHSLLLHSLLLNSLLLSRLHLHLLSFRLLKATKEFMLLRSLGLCLLVFR